MEGLQTVPLKIVRVVLVTEQSDVCLDGSDGDDDGSGGCGNGMGGASDIYCFFNTD